MGVRFWALVIDAVVVTLVQAVLIATMFWQVVAGLVIFLLGTVAGLLGLVWMMAVRGTSPGKELLHIRVVRERDGNVPGWGIAVGRYLLRGLLLGVTVYIAGLSPMWDSARRQRAWWDRAVGTIVVRAPNHGVQSVSARGVARPGATGVAATSASQFAPPPGPQGPTGPAPAATELNLQAHPVIASGPGVQPPVRPQSDQPPRVQESPVVQEPPVSRMPHGWRQESTGQGGSPQRGSEAGRLITAVPGFSAVATPPGSGEEPDAVRPSSESPALSGQATPSLDMRSALSPARRDEPSLEDRDEPGLTRATGSWHMELDDGTVIALDQPVVLGRDPAAEVGERAIALDDTTRSVSKTHLRLGAEAGVVSVTDLHSTNGVAIAVEDAVTQCEPGRPTAVPTGATVRFGDRTMRVHHGAR